jgi:hypothetical protein
MTRRALNSRKRRFPARAVVARGLGYMDFSALLAEVRSPRASMPLSEDVHRNAPGISCDRLYL